MILLTHSWLRWIVLALGIVVFAITLRGWRGGQEWSAGHGRLHKAFVGALDGQAFLGLSLYLWLSPLVRTGTADLRAALGDSLLRFYSVEHAFGMLVGVLLVHIVSARARRSEDGRHRAVCLGQIVWLLITLVSIPWPGLPYGRPLFRF